MHGPDHDPVQERDSAGRKDADEQRVPGIADDPVPVVSDGGQRREDVEGGVQQTVDADQLGSGGVRFEPDGAEVVSAGEPDVGVEGGGEAAQEGDGGLGAAFLDALDVVVGQGRAGSQFGDG